MAHSALFLDRDGTIVEDVGYLNDPDGLVIYEGAFAAVQAIRELGFKTVVVTNQSGLARGLIDENTLNAIHECLRDVFLHQGAPLDAVYYCPHHPEATVQRYRRHCSCRKPEPGLLRRAAEALEIDLARSYLVGDKISDIVAGHRAGCRSILVRTGQGMQSIAELDANAARSGPHNRGIPDYIADDVLKAAEWIVERHRAVDTLR